MKNPLIFAYLIFSTFCAFGVDNYTVASFNILGGNVLNPAVKERAEIGCELVAFHDFDIFGVQEMRVPQSEIYLQSGAYQMAGDVVAPNIEVPEWQRWGNFIFFKKDKFSLVSNGRFWLSQTPDKPSIGWDEKQYRICNWVKLKDKKSARIVYFFNLHQGLTENARLGAIEVVKNKIGEIVEGDAVVFLTGDFNAYCDSASINSLLEGGALLDSWRISKTKPFGPAGTFCKANHDKELCDGAAKTGKKIDYIFVSKNVAVKKCATLTYNIDGKYPSDHLPIMAVVEVE